MRITNKMMTNNVLHNIGNNKQLLSKLENQYSTGKKIQKPSDDPIIAVRALKLRTSLSELTQYVEKNIPDAINWMDTTECAVTNINSILRQMNTYCDQGANDTLTATDRDNIIINLEELKQQIYQEGNSNYAGRYVFTGYKTDTSLLFKEYTEQYQYTINEPLSKDDIMISSKIVSTVDVNSFDKENPEQYDTQVMPNVVQTYRMRLAYSEIDENSTFSFQYKDAKGATKTIDQSKIKNIASTDANAYTPKDDEIHFIPETGELILGKDVYKQVYNAEEIQVQYTKSKFDKNNLRPEHYFTCTRVDTNTNETLQYKKEIQEMQYEINYNQKLTVNTQCDEVFTHDVERALDDIVRSVNDVIETENKIKEVEKMLEDRNLTTTQKSKLEGMLEQLNSEFTLRTDVMQKSFARGLSDTAKQQDKVNEALSALGGNYNRLLLTQGRLEDQQVEMEELLSTNEDVDLVDTIVKFTSAETVYNSSLSAASKLVQSSLLDFLR